MAGKRVLLAAEFLRGGATLTRLLPLAHALAALGHEVRLAAPAGVAADMPVIEAPRWAVAPPPGYAALSYADLLMHGGFAAPDSLRGLLSGWQAVLEAAAPDLLVVDFAPSAMLAARVAGVKMAAVGDGFSLPPLTEPFPAMRPWDALAPGALYTLERRILAVINVRLVAMKQPRLGALRALFDCVPGFLCGFPELDPYAGRGAADWYGAVFPPAGAALDLDLRHPALAAAGEALGRIGREAADVVVCQATESVVSALLAGKLVLMLPIFLEQTMTLHALMRQGLGLGVPPGSDAAGIEAGLRRLLGDAGIRRRVAGFAASYAGYRPAIAIEAIAEEIDAMLTA